MNIQPFLRRGEDRIFLLRNEAWLVLAPRGHGWLFGNLDEARRAARWLSRNYDLPIEECFYDFAA